MSPPLHLDLRRVLADRHGPEAASLFRTLLGFVERRVGQQARTRCRGLLTEADQEEILGEVLFRLMEGALARFRGETLGELLAFVRVMTDRTSVRRAQRRLRERATVDDQPSVREEAWTDPNDRAADAACEFDACSPLDEADRAYLTELLRAGSKAELARRHDVSRAAVTQRVARIRARVEQLSPRERASHEAWMQRTALEALEQAGLVAK